MEKRTGKKTRRVGDSDRRRMVPEGFGAAYWSIVCTIVWIILALWIWIVSLV